jgi:hypothetical protein
MNKKIGRAVKAACHVDLSTCHFGYTCYRFVSPAVYAACDALLVYKSASAALSRFAVKQN